ncbi:unnamed protein product [Cunninghamella echinulata]
MGISGLLSVTKSIQKSIHIKEYSGRRVAVDANVWLHKGAFICAKELVMGEPTTVYVSYFMKQINMLLHFNVIPVVVFDGDSLPIENIAKTQRRKIQKEARSKGMDYLRKGEVGKATDCFQKSIHVTPEMIQTVIKALNDKNVIYIQAPFETEAQLTYLCQSKMVDAVIAETSNLLAYGCPVILYKLNPYGEATQIRSNDIKNIEDLDFSTWGLDQFRNMCILSGCDYLSSLRGIGLKMAYKLLAKYKTMDRVFANLRFGKIQSNPDYEEKFNCVCDIFKYQYVYDPKKKEIVRMNDFDKEKGENKSLAHLGEINTMHNSKIQLSPPLSTPTITTDHVKAEAIAVHSTSDTADHVKTTKITTTPPPSPKDIKRKALTTLESNINKKTKPKDYSDDKNKNNRKPLSDRKMTTYNKSKSNYFQTYSNTPVFLFKSQNENPFLVKPRDKTSSNKENLKSSKPE